jgi:hypothetical protein
MEAQGFTYHYHASALGLGGVLKDERGVTTLVPSLASTALADSGGEGFMEITNYDKDGVSFSHASCRVLGYDSEHRTFTTSADIYITNLNLFGRVKAAVLQTSMSSTRLVDGDATTESDPDKARFSMHSMIRGLIVDGVEVIPQLDTELFDWPTFSDFDRQLTARSSVPANMLVAPVVDAQLIRTSFVKALDHAPAPTLGSSQGFKLPVTRFGNVHFGELIVKRGTRRVNLLRIAFDSTLTVEQQRSKRAAARGAGGGGSPLGGTMTMLSLDSNGAPSWP